MRTNDVMLSVSQVCEMPPGDENNASWINPGFAGEVRSINQRKTKAGKPFWVTTIGDVNTEDTIEVSFFTAPRFNEGDLVDLYGKGLRRTEYNGKPQAAVGKDTEVRVTSSARSAAPAPALAQAPAPAAHAPASHIGAVNGQTVGMAMKASLDLLLGGLSQDEKVARLISPEFWGAVHEVASDIVRVSLMMEKGKLAPAIRERHGGRPQAPAGGRADAPKSDTRPQPGPGGTVALPDEGEDVPF